MMILKNSKMNKDWEIAESLLDELQYFAKLHNQTKNIQYSIYYENDEYHIRIEKDEEHILKDFLERLDE